MYYVYVIRSGERKYIGYTRDLRRRMEEHNRGENRSTRGRKWELVYYEAYRDESDARERERKLKQRGRSRQILYERIKRSMS